MKVQIVVTHLLGTGHLARALTLAEAFKQAGHKPLVVSGGMPAPHLNANNIDVVQLPPVRSDGVDFSTLLDGSGSVIGPHYMQDRTAQLIDKSRTFAPDALITELFPFGRRILKNEFLALLDAIKAIESPLCVFASIRDILAPPSKPKKAAFTEETITSYYDAVLVHSDPDLTPLELSWPVSDILQTKLCYTGFVAPPPVPKHPERLGSGEILVSAGGGPVGRQLFECARLAASMDQSRAWRILVGGQDAVQQIETLQTQATGNLSVEPVRADFRQMLHHAGASLSFCGYNTAQDLLQTSCPAVLVPFDEGGEVEQGIRANALNRLSGVEVLRSEELTPAAILEKIAIAVSAPRRPTALPANGAVKAVRIVERICQTGA